MPEDHDAPHDVLAAEEFAVPAPDPALLAEDAHDVLAAEEFVLPAPDPALTREEAHDVLAAEEFAVPAADPVLRDDAPALELPVDPADPGGAEPAHDVLAAEEFALPAPAPHAVPPDFAGADVTRPRGRRLRGPVLGLGLSGIVLALRRRRRRR